VAKAQAIGSGPLKGERTEVAWAQAIPARFIDIGGTRLRYITVGEGPPLVLLHTLRTQLDVFEHMFPPLARRFTVYAFDYPGHGQSDAPRGLYDAAFFSSAVAAFLEELDLRDVTLAGVSIGGVVPLILAARHNERVRRVVSINPYDYERGRGLARSSAFGWIVTFFGRIPVVGEIVIPLAPRWLVRRVLAGGVANPEHLSTELADKIHEAGRRPGQARAFLSLLRNARSWQDAQRDYGSIDKPVLLIWGERDWSRPAERTRTASLIPGVVVKVVPGAGHFLPLDKPDELSALICDFADA
jgi:pimeloyl-ACP methyl ester carboxylesterase